MTGSLQAATERDIGVPDFDRDEKDTTLLQLGTLLGRSFPPHVKSIFSCDFPACPGKMYLSLSQRHKPMTTGLSLGYGRRYPRALILMRWQQYTILLAHRNMTLMLGSWSVQPRYLYTHNGGIHTMRRF